MKERSGLHFLFLTKRIERFMDCIPDDWGDGYENVTVGCTIENQDRADFRLNIFSKKYLDGVELVVVGGESDRNARPLDYDWVLDIRNQCMKKQVNFEFRQCGTHFMKEGKQYTIPTKQLMAQARKANINYTI